MMVWRSVWYILLIWNHFRDGDSVSYSWVKSVIECACFFENTLNVNWLIIRETLMPAVALILIQVVSWGTMPTNVWSLQAVPLTSLTGPLWHSNTDISIVNHAWFALLDWTALYFISAIDTTTLSVIKTPGKHYLSLIFVIVLKLIMSK